MIYEADRAARSLVIAILCLTVFVTAIIFSSSTFAVDDKSTTSSGMHGEIRMYIFKDHLRNILKEIAKRKNISLKIDRKVDGIIKKKMLIGSRRSILTALSIEHGFDWFEYNSTLYVSNKSDRSTKFFTMNMSELDYILQKLNRQGANINKFQTQSLNRKTVSISGPPTYLAILETIIAAQSIKKKKVTRSENVLLYKGVKLHKIELETTRTE